MRHFLDQHWVVVGCSRRLGLFMTRKLIEEGAKVTGLYREISDPISELKAQFPCQLTLKAYDLRKMELLDGSLETLFQGSDKIDGVIHLASQFFPTPLLKVKVSDWDILYDTNVKGHFFLTQLLIPYLKIPSSIIYIVDIYATKPLKNFIAYASAKGALLSLMKNLALELAPQIRVNAISPGSVLLPESYNQEEIDRHIENTLLKRLGSPEDIYQAFDFLSRNSYLTGVNLKVDGGTSLC